MENWDDYRFILALDRCRTLRAAATLLGVNHSTVSRRLTVINARYDSPVFEQAAVGYVATQFGKKLVDAAVKMEELNFATNRRHKASGKGLSGPITLSVPGVLARYVLMEPLTQFCREHPGIQLSIQSTYRFADLNKSEADVVVRGTNTPPEHLVGRRLFTYGLSHYCSADYLATTAPEDRRWITNTTGNKPPNWIKHSPFPDTPVGLQIDDIELRHRAAIMGQGMSLGACYIADAEPRLARLPGATLVPGQDFWVLTHPDLKDTPRIRVLMQSIVAALMANRALIEGAST